MSRRLRPSWVTAALASVIAFAIYGPPRSGPSVSPSPVRFEVPPPEGTLFNVNPGRTFFALSPDGSQLAFVAEPAPGSTGRSRVWVRAVADLEARPLPGTEGATSVFWSPDGRSLAFFAERKLKRIDLPDGAVVTICDVRSDLQPRHLGSRGRHPAGTYQRNVDRRCPGSGRRSRPDSAQQSIEGRSARALAVVPPRWEALLVHGAPR